MPLWAKILVVVSTLPALDFFYLLSRCPAGGEAETLLKFYPLYTVVAAVCAWICWGRRTEVAWILIALMWLSHAAMFVLANGPQ